MASKHLAGGKYSRGHTTVISAAIKPIQAANRLACVTKISLGVIKRAPSGLIGLKFAEESPTCLKITVRGTTSVQHIRVYHEKCREEVERAMRGAR